MKSYHPEKGVPLDGDFLTHSAKCDRCKLFDAERPATMSLMCLEGSILWKREHGVAAPKVSHITGNPDHRASKEELRKAMKYK